MSPKYLSGFFTYMVLTVGLFLPNLPVCPMKLLISPAYCEEIVLATVNDVPIYQSELDSLIAEFKQKAGKAKITPEEKKQLIKNLAIRQLILQQPETQALKNNANIIKKVKAFEDSLIISYFVKTHVKDGVNITEDELRQYYKDHQSQFTVSQQLEVRVILLKTREDAEHILKQLHQGEDFAKLAAEYSMDLPSAKKGGSLGKVERGKVLPQIWRAIFELKEGEVSDIIETDFGYNILTVDKIVAPEKIKPFEEVKTDIERQMLPKKREEIYDEMVKELQKGAKIEIFEDRFLETSNPPS